ncbi:MAG: DUF3179 domain-containing protein [Chloroflexi bacterium]|nr:MAG: DUF3179 domain-containing protein [Chloroflexota bacterium]
MRAALALASVIVAAACARQPVTAAPWSDISCASAVGSPANASDVPGFSTAGWKTDFARHCVPLSEVTSGGPPRDGIPPLDDPTFEETALADAWLKPQEPVIVVAESGTARAYPLQVLIWHEIVNDTFGQRPIVVTFCPLCNTSLVFDRRAAGRDLTFGTTGDLRYSDLVMWDRQTESFWQQATGEAIVGTLTGTRLDRVASAILSYADFKRAYPDGRVLSRDGALAEVTRKTGHGRDYGTNPYSGYDRADSPPIAGFFGNAPLDPRLPPKARVAIATFSRPPVGYPLGRLSRSTAINDTVGGRQVVLLYGPGVASPLDRPVTSAGDDVGQAVLYDPVVDGRALTFRADGSHFVDDQTGSRWAVSGVAVAGPLAGRRLTLLAHEVTFWFIWAVFHPETEIRDR